MSPIRVRSASTDWNVNVGTHSVSSLEHVRRRRSGGGGPCRNVLVPFFVMTTAWLLMVPTPPELMLPLMLLSKPRPNSALQRCSRAGAYAAPVEPAGWPRARA